MKCMCWICWGDALLTDIYGDWDELECTECGRYIISRTLLKECLGEPFDVQETRAELELWRPSGHVPVISFRNARLMKKTQPPMHD